MFTYINKDSEYIIKIEGRATMKNSKTLSDFIDNIFTKLDGLSFEMSEVTYMDSTFLGLVAKYSIDMQTNKEKSLIILNPSKETINYFKQTGIDKFLKVINQNDILEISNKIEENNFENMTDKAKYILNMHEILMNLNDANKLEFQSVVDEMRKVIK